MLLAGCGSSSFAPVSERSLGAQVAVKKSKRPPPASGYYRVQPGDTLYSIAWRYGKDYRALARANGIGSDFRIFPGQRLRLTAAPVSSRTKAAPKRASKPATPAAQKPKPASRPTARVAAAAPLAKVRWRWPAPGKILRPFQSSGKVNNGLDLAGNRGDPVFSAASGRVVYAGSGLLGYGNLIIINHNEQYLSAYAHNSRLLVKESQTVRGGQKIAEMGNSGATRTMLHFEIRKDGKPVNPLHYLPKR